MSDNKGECLEYGKGRYKYVVLSQPHSLSLDMDFQQNMLGYVREDSIGEAIKTANKHFKGNFIVITCRTYNIFCEKDNEEVVDNEDNSKRVLCKAMIRAEEAFFEYIEKDGQIDGAYFELKLIGYELDMDFERMNQVVMKTPETKNNKECECDLSKL